MKTKFLLAVSISASLFVGLPYSTVSAASAGGTCKKIGSISGTLKKPLVCKKVSGKLKWVASAVSTNSTPSVSAAPITTAAPATTTTAAPATTTTARPTTTTPAAPVLAGTVSQRNAVSKGASYLRSSSFSRSGLISQLQYEGFSLDDATYGTDAQNADWSAQAVKRGTSYLRSSSFSRSSLINQLQYEGFSASEATYGTDAQNADWTAQAAKKAASYLKSSSFSRTGLIDQLLYEGFSQAQAEYGVSTTGL